MRITINPTHARLFRMNVEMPIFCDMHVPGTRRHHCASRCGDIQDHHERHTLDLYPTPGPHPLIISIHVGAFWMGSKANGIPLAILNREYVMIAMSCRLSYHAVFPVQIEDCNAAVRWAQTDAGTYNFDTMRFVAKGKSAMLGTSRHVRTWDMERYLDRSSRVQAVIDVLG